jgi:hypothetical protein
MNRYWIGRSTNVAVKGPVPRWPRFRFAFGGRRVDSREVAVKSAREIFIPPATLAVVKTKTDDNYGWLAAGQTMARAILQARALGLPWAFFNQVGRREAREALRRGVGHKGFAQVVLRFGSIPIANHQLNLSGPIYRRHALAAFR